jgi:hypothetical protein
LYESLQNCGEKHQVWLVSGCGHLRNLCASRHTALALFAAMHWGKNDFGHVARLGQINHSGVTET